MKKILFVVVLLMPMFLNAQEKEEKSNSKTLEFLAKDGSVLKKEFYDLPEVGSSYNRTQNQVLIITDLKSNEKRGCLRIITSYSSSTSGVNEYIGTLDPDELDAATVSMEKILNEIIPTTPETYTEVVYKTRDGIQIGAFWKEKKKEWTIYIQTKSYSSRSMSTYKSEELATLIKNLKDAKQLIIEKTK
ncbi:MAG: hypothetical protein E7107_07765 [Prevotella sp.]|nr:hypothetical protein [Prevotella sp.]